MTKKYYLGKIIIIDQQVVNFIKIVLLFAIRQLRCSTRNVMLSGLCIRLTTKLFVESKARADDQAAS